MSEEGESDGPLIVVARGIKARGLKGELVADLLTDFPERFAAIARLICLDPKGNRTEGLLVPAGTRHSEAGRS